jgi:hypothetical protein
MSGVSRICVVHLRLLRLSCWASVLCSILSGTSREARQECPHPYYRTLRARRAPSSILHRLVHQPGRHVCGSFLDTTCLYSRVWFQGAWRCGTAIGNSCGPWSSQRHSLRRLRCLIHCGLVRVRIPSILSPPLYLPNLTISVIPTAFHLRGKELRAQLSQACVSAGIPPPLPQSPDLAPLYPATRVLTSQP